MMPPRAPAHRRVGPNERCTRACARARARKHARVGEAGNPLTLATCSSLPALEVLGLGGNPFGDEGLAALVAPPAPAGAPPPPTGVLAELQLLHLSRTQISDAGCATLAAALANGALPALKNLHLNDIPTSAAAKAAVFASGSYLLVT